ncbi:MAG: VWA domain-containing protein [Sandaracinus sp.]|nr:VWA domain-containing protein [Sandaracinus sp.]
MLELDVAPERPTLPDTASHARFEVRIRADGPPLHRRVVLVLDRSSSMAGRSFVYARRLAAGLLALLPDGTEVTLVAFDAHATLVLPPTSLDGSVRMRALHALRALDVGHGTSFDAALGLGLGLAAPNGHLVLLTDGFPSYGATEVAPLTAQVLRRGATTLTTLGIGAGSHDLLLSCLARAGGGDAHFAEDLGADDLAAGLGHELALVEDTVANEVDLVLHPATSVRLDKLWYRGPASREQGARVIRLPRLVRGRPLSLALQVAWESRNPERLGLVELRARDADGREHRREAELAARYGRGPADPVALAGVLLTRLHCAVHDAAIDGSRAAPIWLATRIAELRALADQEHLDAPELRRSFELATRALQATGPRALARHLRAVERKSLAPIVRTRVHTAIAELRHKSSIVPIDD